MKNISRNTKTIFLTFDDGPVEPDTPLILEALKAARAEATFFVCGKNLQHFPQLAKRIVAEGHIIANHTYSHSPLKIITGLFLEEIEVTNDLIEEITGIQNIFFRPPWGIITPWLKKQLQARGFHIILYDVHAKDWREPPAEKIALSILRQLHPGAIVLLHDGYGTRSKGNRRETGKAIPLIVKEARRQGYVFEAVDKLFENPG